MGFLEERRRTKEIKREIKFKKGKAQIESYLRKCRQGQKRYWELGKKALRLGDREQFKRIATAYLWNLEQVNQWERYLLQLETLSARRDQVKATGEFLSSLKALSDSMLKGVSPEEIAKMEVQLERAVAKASCLEEALNVVMETSAQSLFLREEFSEESISQLEKGMAQEAEHEEETAFDTSIEESLKKIEHEMKKELP